MVATSYTVADHSVVFVKEVVRFLGVSWGENNPIKCFVPREWRLPAVVLRSSERIIDERDDLILIHQ